MKSTGCSDYPYEAMASLDELLLDAHQVARELVAYADAGTGTERTNVLVYGALAPGWVAAHALAAYPQLNVLGLADQAHERFPALAALGLHHSCGSSGLPILSPEEIGRGEPVHAVVVAVAPRHHAAVEQLLARQLPDARVVFLHRSNQALPLRPSATPFVVATPGRCGTLWITNLLRSLLYERGYRLVSAGDNSGDDHIVLHHVAERLEPSRFSIDHFAPTDGLRARIADKSLRAIHLFRDPRDIQVSASFKNHGEFRFDRQLLETKLGQIESWLGVPGVLHVRYEELRANTAGTLERVLAHIGAHEEPERVQSVVDLFDFKYLSGGRKPGQEDTGSHYRKGVCGDWRNRYSTAQADECEARFGGRIKALGYD